jgi:hypothetical protein
MAKLTKKKFDEYKNTEVNGFKVNLSKLVYNFAHGDEYPQMIKIIKDDLGLNDSEVYELALGQAGFLK